MHSDSSYSPPFTFSSSTGGGGGISSYSGAIPSHSQTSNRFRLCAVCSGQSNGFYFGVLSCRACASFFRRSALERRQYLCRRANNCAIQADGMRNSCRACRLSRCIQAGMCMDSQLAESKMGSSTPENNIQQQSSGSADEMGPLDLADPTKLNFKMTFDISTPNIHHFAQSIRNINNGLKALVNVICNRGLTFRDQELHQITLDEHLKTHRGEVTLLLTIMREHFPGLDSLPNEIKVLILKCFAFRLAFMSRAEMTIRTFPEQTKEIRKLILHPGYYLDKFDMDYFFSSTPNGTFSEDHKNHCLAMMEKIGKLIIEKYLPLEISQLEFAAMIGIQLWNSVERYMPLTTEMKEKRNELFAELHALLAKRLGANSAAIGIRFGQLLTFIQDISVHSWEVEEVFTVLKIFNPIPMTDLWDDLLSGKQNLDIVEQTATMEKTVIALSREEY